MNRYLLLSVLAVLASCSAASNTDDSIADLPYDVPITYTLSITSSDEEQVPIQGSIYYDAGGSGFAQIATTTPFEKSVDGLSVIILVRSTIPGRKINVVLEANGTRIIKGQEDQRIALADNAPAQGSRWVSSH